MKKRPKFKNLIEKLEHDLRASGFVGDTTLPKLIWLASHTRHFDKPVSVVVLGPSGSGKSFALETALKFVPGDAFHMFHGMSEKAIIYSVDLDLRNKFIVIQEAAGLKSGQGRVMLRQLLSEGKATYRTVQQPEGILEAQELKLEGPTGLFMTTTATDIHPEDASRMLCIHVEEKHEHIREVLLAQAAGGHTSDREPNFEWWKHFGNEKLADARQVEIPFATELAAKIPVSHFRVQRDFPQILSLIRACALLHGKRREVDDHGHVVALLDDYEMVRELVAPALAQGLEASVSDSIRSVVESVKRKTEKPRRGREVKVTLRAIADDLGWDRSVVSRNVTKAIGLGFLFDDNPGQGRESDLSLGERKLETSNGDVLPTVDEIRIGMAAVMA